MTFSFKLVSQARLQVDADPTSFFLSAEDVENLIVELAKLRRGMLPEVPKTAPDGQRELIVDPAFSGGIVPAGMALVLRHPGIGWLGFLFPLAEARKLASGLAQFVASMSSQPQGTSRRH
jgi:hypothetical protein